MPERAYFALVALCLVIGARCYGSEPIRFGSSPSFVGQAQQQAEADKAATTGAALTITIPRRFARPGDRWIETVLDIRKPAGTPLEGLRLNAALFRFGEDKPVAEAGATPARNRGLLLADLRSLGLSEARLRVALSDGQKTLIIRETLLSARGPAVPLAAGQKIPILLDLPSGVDGVGAWPVCFGVPFAEGSLWDVESLRVTDNQGREIPAQREPVARWAKDGAIQWVRFDALVSSKDGCQVEVAPPGSSAKPAAALTLVEKDDRIEMSTGVARYILSKGPSPIEEIWLGANRVAAAQGTRGLYVVDQTGRVASASAGGETMDIEARGPVAACVRFEGFYRTAAGEPLARHITRVEAFAGQGFAKVTHTLVLSEDTNKVWFKDIGWEFAVASGGNPSALFGVSRAEWQKSVSQPLNSATPSAYMLQDQHYHMAHSTNHFLAARTDAAGKAATLTEGEECGDWAALVGADGGLAIACKETARQHPKEFEAFQNRIVLHLFSGRAGEELDFRMPALIRKWDLVNWYKKALPANYSRDEVAGKVETVVSKHSSNASGWAKTHELLVTPCPPATPPLDLARLAYLNRHPVHALPDPQWTYKTEALGPLHPKDPKRFPQAEKLIETMFDFWADKIPDWGDYGFVDYFSGPHLQYNTGKYADTYRYSPLITYTLRHDLWLVYARSGERRVREFAENTTRAYMDDVFCHWDGDGRIRGLYAMNNEDDNPFSKFCLPLYWQGRAEMETQSATGFDQTLRAHYLSGDRRAKDCILEYASGIKKFWTPERAKREWRGIMAMRLMAQAYGFTWDEDLRALAEATADAFEDTEGAIGLSKERPYRSSTYKTQVDVAALLDAWQILGTPRYHDMALKVSRHWWGVCLGENPIFYCNPQGRIGNFLYRETGDPSYPEMLALQVRQAASALDPKTGKFLPDEAARMACEKGTFIFQGIPYAQDVIVCAGADRAPASSWVACEDFSFPVSIVARKADKGTLNIVLKTGASADGSTGPGVVGGVCLRPIQPSTTWGLDLNSLSQASEGVVRVFVPKDAPDGAYEVLPPRGASHLAVADGRVPLVLHAPEYWRPMPRQDPPVKWYFSVPKDAQEPQIFFEGDARLYDPQGKPWPEDKTVKGWIALPPAKPGLWAMQPLQNLLVCVRNVPPFFAARDPQNYFEPEIAWRRQTPYQPPAKPAAGATYVPGAIEAPGDQALYLGLGKSFTLAAGPADPAGGGRFLPLNEGTIEFFFKPYWSTFDLPSPGAKCLIRLPADREDWTIAYNKDAQATTWLGSHVLLAYFMTDGAKGRKSMRTYRRALFAGDEWVHVAWVWGPREYARFGGKQTRPILTTRIYVNGRLGQQYPYQGADWDGNHPVGPPKALQLGPDIDAAYDELRVSDIQRYADEFTPPSRERMIQADKNTRALFHFNGDLKGESSGYAGDLPAALK